MNSRDARLVLQNEDGDAPHDECVTFSHTQYNETARGPLPHLQSTCTANATNLFLSLKAKTGPVTIRLGTASSLPRTKPWMGPPMNRIQHVNHPVQRLRWGPLCWLQDGKDSKQMDLALLHGVRKLSAARSNKRKRLGALGSPTWSSRVQPGMQDPDSTWGCCSSDLEAS